jgi:hypothetical protein
MKQLLHFVLNHNILNVIGNLIKLLKIKFNKNKENQQLIS